MLCRTFKGHMLKIFNQIQSSSRTCHVAPMYSIKTYSYHAVLYEHVLCPSRVMYRPTRWPSLINTKISNAVCRYPLIIHLNPLIVDWIFFPFVVVDAIVSFFSPQLCQRSESSLIVSSFGHTFSCHSSELLSIG